MTHHGPSQIEVSCPLRSRSPCGARFHPSILPCSILSASLRSALRLPFGLPSLPPFGACLRFGGLSSPNLKTGCASRHTRSMAMCEIQTFSTLFFVSSPGDASTIPSSSPIALRAPGFPQRPDLDVGSSHRLTAGAGSPGSFACWQASAIVPAVGPTRSCRRAAGRGRPDIACDVPPALAVASRPGKRSSRGLRLD